jgi:lipoprotein signal peptidase
MTNDPNRVNTPQRAHPRLWTWLWPTWPGMAVPGLWAAYIACAAMAGQFQSPREGVAALWPAVLLYLGSCGLAACERGRHRPALATLVLAGVALAVADLAIKAWIEATVAQARPLPAVPGLVAIDPVYNVYGTMLAISGARPFVTTLAVALVPLSVLGYRHYVVHDRPVAWSHAAFLGLFAGALGKAGDLLLRGQVLDYLHIPGLPVADLADVYLLWVGGGCALAASLCYPDAWPDLRLPLRRLGRAVRRVWTQLSRGSGPR